MILVFVDETSDTKFDDYFGLCLAIINHTQYKQIKQGFQTVLRKSQWDESVEFKGSFLFSASKGDPKVNIEERIKIAHSILDLNIAKKNARMSFHYLMHKADKKDHPQQYLKCFPLLLEKALPKANKKHGKDIISISCDYRSDLSNRDVQKAIMPMISKTGYTLFEEVTTPHSNFETVGILYSDIVGYLAARVDTISNDIELFENIPRDQIENNGKVRKLRASKALIEKIKKLEKYKLVIKGK